MDSNAQATLKEVVLSTMNLLNQDESEYFRYYQIAIECFRDLKMNFIKGVQITQLPMDTLNRISLPSDCVKVLAIGIPYNGRLWTFTIDNDIYKYTSIENGVDTSESDIDLETTDNLNNVGFDVKGGINEWYYTVDYTTRLIHILGVNRSDVTIHYVSDGISIDGITYIPREAFLPLRAYLIKIVQDYDPTISMVQKSVNRENYNEQMTRLIRFHAPTIDQIRDTYLKTIYQTPKR